MASILDILTNRTSIDSKNPDMYQSKYDFDFKVFPEDLGSDYIPHYMLININIPVKSGTNTPRGSYYGDITGEGGRIKSDILPSEFSKVDNLRFSGKTSPIIGETGSAYQSEYLTPLRQTRRIAQSIALYMPSPLVYTQSSVYEEISLTQIAGMGGRLAASGAGQFLGAAAGAFLSGSIGGAFLGAYAGGNLVNQAGGVVGTAMSLGGMPINPRVEVLFATTPQRQFVFEFLLSPKSERESNSLREIVRTMRFHGAPEIDNTLGIIPTFISPAEFDITFYHGNKENLNIPRINTCVLERCEIDYAPSGAYSTFWNGHPVSARMSLAFREIEINHKRRIVQGF